MMDPCVVCNTDPEISAVPATTVIDGIPYCKVHMPPSDPAERRVLGSDRAIHGEDQTVDAAPEAVNHPSHYGGEDNPYEVIKVIMAWGLGFDLGNAVKYLARAGKKDPAKEIEDLKKARFYVEHAIKLRESGYKGPL